MPEIFPSSPDARISALEDFFTEPVSPTTRCQGRRMARPNYGSSGHGNDHHPLRLGITHGNARINKQRRAARANPRQSLNVPVSRGGRKPGTSQYYGVRFRPDLQKWVAEIRVAEWKSVDKKVWLGTFDTEQAAARGVDLARKLLNCKKKNPPNLPCERLAGYSQKIPSYLNLHDLFDSNMFKQVVTFIKQACKDYAASFDSTPAQASELEHQEYEVITDMSEVSDMIMEMTSVSYPDGSSCCNYEVAMSSPTGSCSSGVTLVEELQAPQLEARDGYFSAASSEFQSGDEGLACQPWAEHVYTIWPELQDPCFLPELPETFYGMSPWNGPFLAGPLDFGDYLHDSSYQV